MRRWTISDVAREARVSKTTVSRVLNDKPDVDAETSARVREVVNDLGFVQSVRAVRLAKGQSDCVGLLAPFYVSPWNWLLEVLRGAMEEVEASDYSLMLHALPENEAAERRFSGQLRSGLVDALLVVSLFRPLPMIERAAKAGLPIVFVNDFGFNVGGPSFASDDVTGIIEAVAHLYGVGRRRFAILTGPAGIPVSQVRLDAYRDAIHAHGLELDPKLIVTAPFTEKGARAGTIELIGRREPFDALFASSDAMAVGAMQALQANGLRIPGDVSVVGFDDFPSAEVTQPRLTTVRYPLHEMSLRAVRSLIEAVKESRPVQAGSEVFKTRLVIRDSSDPSLQS